MARPKIFIDENIPYMRGRLERDADVEYISQDAFSKETVKDADALIVRTRTICNRQLLEDSHVKMIATATIGTDHIDLDYCRNQMIAVANAPGCNAPGVAQYVWSSLLSSGFRPGKDKLGIIGCGNVGKIVAQWGLLLSTEILVSDPPKKRANPDWLDNEPYFQQTPGNIRYASLDEILRECDAVTIHTPLTRTGTDATHHLIGDAQLRKMKKDSILINAARGPVVDSKALLQYLKEGRIRTITDTWEGEPSLDPELLRLTGIATPHIAGYSRQGKERATRMAIEAVRNFFNIRADISGLEGGYMTPEQLDTGKIKASYDPKEDDKALKANPDSFEQLRHDYHYREEVK